MGKINPVPQVSNLKTLDELTRFLQPFLGDVGTAINGNISIVDNLSTSLVEVYFGAAGVSQSIEHKLPRTPTGYFIVKTMTPTAESIVDGTGTTDATVISLKPTVGGSTVKILFF
jgi:hypothetical protein